MKHKSETQKILAVRDYPTTTFKKILLIKVANKNGKYNSKYLAKINIGPENFFKS